MRVVKPNHLAGPHAEHDASGGPCIFPHERVYRARALLAYKKGEKPLPAESSEDRLIRPHGAEIGDVLVSESGRAAAPMASAVAVAARTKMERSKTIGFLLLSAPIRKVPNRVRAALQQAHIAMQ